MEHVNPTRLNLIDISGYIFNFVAFKPISPTEVLNCILETLVLKNIYPCTIQYKNFGKTKKVGFQYF